MARMWSSDIRPGYVPAGFRLLAAAEMPVPLDGDAPPGGDRPGEEAAVSYTRGDDLRRALRIQAGPRSAGISSRETGGHAGIPVDLGAAGVDGVEGVDGVQAIYQDGVWVMGPGPDQRRVGEGLTIHWDTSDLHSLTLVGPDSEVTVRGARSLGVTFDELVRVAASLDVSVPGFPHGPASREATQEAPSSPTRPEGGR